MMVNDTEIGEAICAIHPDVKNLIQQSRLQYNDAISVLKGKNKETVVEQGIHTRKVLAETVFSLKDVCDNLFDAVLKLAGKDASSDVDRIVSKFTDIVDTRFTDLAQQISTYGMQPNVGFPPLADQRKEKHVILVKEKNSTKVYNEQTWSNVVKGTIESSLKEIPVNRSVLNKSGQGCLFFPNKKAQEDAQSALQSLFDCTTSSKPSKDIMPKVKIFDIDVNLYSDKNVLRQAILEKNPDICAFVEDSHTFDVILINTSRNFAIIKVSPDIRNVLMAAGNVFLGMQSHRFRDHFQPLQCYACQRHGHKQGSQDCRYHGDASRNNTCLYCSDNHMSKDCPVKRQPGKHICVNCKHSDRHEHKANVNHTSTSLKCPFVLREINALIKRTTGINDTEAKNLRIRMSSRLYH